MSNLPKTMPAAVFMGLRDVAVEERPTPTPGPGELLLEVSHCGICGSDLHFLVEWGGRTGVIEGHEFSGTVAAVGDGGTGWKGGERGGPGPAAQVRRWRVLPRGARPALRGPGPGRGRRRRLAGGVRPLQDRCRRR